MSDRPGAAVKTLKIVECSRSFTGTDKRGEEFHIYEIKAANPDSGELIAQKLNSFEELPVGETLELTVKPYNDRFTLARSGKVSMKQRVKELESRLEAIEKVIRFAYDQAGKPLPL